MQTSTTNGRLTVTAFKAAVQAIKNLPRNCWNAALEAAESDIAFAGRATAAIGNAASTARTKPASTQRATRTRTRTTGTTRRQRRANAGPQALTDAETKVLAAMPNSGLISQTAITVEGMRPNNIGRSLGTLARKGYVTGEKGGSWRRTAEKLAAVA